MSTKQKDKPNKDEEDEFFKGLGSLFQPLPESLKHFKLDRSICPGKKGSSNKKTNQTKLDPNGVFVELPPELTPTSKNSMWANVNLYYVEGQEKRSLSVDSMQPPKYILPKLNSNSKTKRSLRFTTTIPRVSDVKKTQLTGNTTRRRKSLKFSNPIVVPKKQPTPNIQITVPKDEDDTSILNDLEQLKNLKLNMVKLVENIQRKIDSNKENRVKPAKPSGIPKSSSFFRNIKNNDSLKAFELEEQLLAKTPRKTASGIGLNENGGDINANIQQFNPKLCDLVDNLEINLFDYMSEIENRNPAAICKEKNQLVQKKLRSTKPEATTQTESRATTSAEAVPSTSNTAICTNVNEQHQKLLASTPEATTVRVHGALNNVELSAPRTPITSKTPLKYNQAILRQYRELKFGVGNVLATPIVEGSCMRLNKKHNLKISQNILKQLNSLDLD